MHRNAAVERKLKPQQEQAVEALVTARASQPWPNAYRLIEARSTDGCVIPPSKRR